jgi:hypothetical protein
MMRLEEVIGDQLEVEGCILAEKVAEHVLTCFWSRDPIVSLDPVTFGPAAETEEASRRPPKSWLHDSSAYQKMHMALIPIFCICQDFFCLCMCKLCYQSLLLVVIDLPESLAAQVPKKNIEKMSVM